jgi:UDP-N-acetylmuramoyl-tripeptide--D-alanyl-D-alanine ligase
MRMQLFTSAGGVTVINDAYNANPVSMRAAVDTLAEMSVPGRRIAVLGDMAELGSLTELAHFQLGEVVAASGIEVLVTVGSCARRIAEGARAAGMPDEAVRPCNEPSEAIEVLDDLLGEGDSVLVKASRVMGLEAVVEGIVNPR